MFVLTVRRAVIRGEVIVTDGCNAHGRCAGTKQTVRIGPLAASESAIGNVFGHGHQASCLRKRATLSERTTAQQAVKPKT